MRAERFMSETCDGCCLIHNFLFMRKNLYAEAIPLLINSEVDYKSANLLILIFQF